MTNSYQEVFDADDNLEYQKQWEIECGKVEKTKEQIVADELDIKEWNEYFMKQEINQTTDIPDADRNDYILEGMTEEDIWGDSLTTTIDCTVRLSDVQFLLSLISQKILGDAVVSNYLCQVWECFSINAKNELQIELSIKDYLDEKGKECCELGYISVPTLLKELEEKDFIPVCKRLVENCERVFYNAYHEHSSDAFPLEFMADKIKRL